MGTDDRQTACEQLIALAEKQGYVTFDNIMDCADEFSLPIQDFDWLSNTITTRGVLVYSEVPTYSPPSSGDEEDENEQDDFDIAFERIIETSPSLEALVSYVKKVPPLQKGEFKQLKYQMYDGNTYARARFVEMHLNLALKAALQRAETYDLDIEETINTACIGLITAADRNDPDLSHGFSAYAKLLMNHTMTREHSTRRPSVHLASHMKGLYLSAYPLLKAEGCLDCEDLWSCNKAVELVSYNLFCSEKESKKIIEMIVPDESIDSLLDSATDKIEDFYPRDTALDEILCDMSSEAIISEEDAFSSVNNQMLRAVLDDLLDTLTPREEKVLKLRFGLIDGHAHTLEEVGAEFRVTRERIRQIESKALRKLRHPSRANRLKGFL